MRSFYYSHRLSAITAFLLALLLFASLVTSRSIGNGYMQEMKGIENIIVARRRMSRLGSAPPTCRSKCGRCLPCKPVHVPIQPGRSMTLEYYPEAWRCKCGNKLFMP
ncbi:hypothetical protein ACHQM5_027443 [Ranunculus cassubicifolius]